MQSRAYMKGAEFKARQGWLPFVDAVGIVLEVLEPAKAAAWEWFKAWAKKGKKHQNKMDKGLELIDLLNGLAWADQPKL